MMTTICVCIPILSGVKVLSMVISKIKGLHLFPRVLFGFTISAAAAAAASVERRYVIGCCCRGGGSGSSQ